MKCPNCKKELKYLRFDKYYCKDCKAYYIVIYHSELKKYNEKIKKKKGGI